MASITRSGALYWSARSRMESETNSHNTVTMTLSPGKPYGIHVSA